MYRHSFFRLFPAVFFVHWLALCTDVLAFAQPGSASSVDAVSLKTGKTLRGVILRRQKDDALSKAVARAWLKKSDPGHVDVFLKQDVEQQRLAWQKTKQHIDDLLTASPNSPSFVFFLKQEQQRLEKQLASDSAPELPFVVIDLPSAQTGKVSPAPLESLRLAIFAWDAGLAGVETRSSESLRKELVKSGADVQGALPDLSGQLPARPQTDDEWAARLAVVRYTLEEPLDFQGTGDFLMATGGARPVDLAAILPQVFGKQLDSLLGDLLAPNPKINVPSDAQTDLAGLQSAIHQAEQEHRDGFRVTRLMINQDRLLVTVESRFVAKLTAGWQSIWMHTETADGNTPRPEQEKQIAADPQVKQGLETLKNLGLGTDDLIDRAVRVGAATMAAQSAADARFFEFRDRYVKRLDGPLLTWPSNK